MKKLSSISSILVLATVVFINGCGTADYVNAQNKGEETVVCEGNDCPKVEPKPDETEPVEEEGCKSAAECDTKDVCKIGVCVNGECVSIDKCPDGYECVGVLGECKFPVKECPPDPFISDMCIVTVCDPITGMLSFFDVNCDDEDEETVDTCESVTGNCHHISSTDCGNCADDDPCTVDFCNVQTGSCEHEKFVCPKYHKCMALEGEPECVFKCESHAACEGPNPCMPGQCDLDTGQCVFQSKDCDDGDPTTTDFCVVVDAAPPFDWFCTNAPTDCTDGCDDSNPCTDDSCDPQTFKCVYEPVSCGNGTFCQDGACMPSPVCQSALDCDDNVLCTQDFCDAGQCVFQLKECDDGEVCDMDGDCVKLGTNCPENCTDDDPCTKDYCDPQTEQCVHDPKPCGEGTFCNANTGNCEAQGCLTAVDCDDENDCTFDYCDGGKCVAQGLPCVGGTMCQNAQCVVAGCEGMADCEDGNPCTVEMCDQGMCVFTNLSCNQGQVCDAFSGDCVDIGANCPEDCSDDDPCTVDFCNVQTEQCENQEFNCPDNFECLPVLENGQVVGECTPVLVEPQECEEDEKVCKTFGDLSLQTVAECQGGVWVVTEVCGLITEWVCVNLVCKQP